MYKIFNNFLSQFRRLYNKALNYSLLTIISQVLLTPINIIIITIKLSPEEQGFYYTFLSLISLQSFFELGLFTYVTNKSSSIFANTERFKINFLVNSESIKLNLGMLFKITIKLYLIISFSFFIIVGGSGLFFFSDTYYLELSEIQWAWISLCFFCAINLFYLGFNSFLEGCGQIEIISKLKLMAFIASGLLLGILLYFEFGLMSLPLSLLPKVFKDIYLMHYVFNKEFNLLIRAKKTSGFNFMSEVAPMQFRLAVSGIFSFMQYSVMAPMVFTVLGPVQAGIIGVGLQITSFVQQILTRWTHIHQPLMAKLVSTHKFTELDQLVINIQSVILKLSIILIIGFVLVFVLSKSLEFHILDRIPGFGIILLLIIAGCVYAQVAVRVGYLRAFVEERVHFMSISNAIFNVVLCYTLLKFIGMYAVPFSYLICMLFVALPWSQRLVLEKKSSL